MRPGIEDDGACNTWHLMRMCRSDFYLMAKRRLIRPISVKPSQPKTKLLVSNVVPPLIICCVHILLCMSNYSNFCAIIGMINFMPFVHYIALHSAMQWVTNCCSRCYRFFILPPKWQPRSCADLLAAQMELWWRYTLCQTTLKALKWGKWLEYTTCIVE